MPFNPHHYVTTKFAEHRAADLRAEVDRHRHVRRAAGASGRQPWAGLPTLVAVALALALLLAASRSVLAETPAGGLLGGVSGAPTGAAPLAAGNDLAFGAAP